MFSQVFVHGRGGWFHVLSRGGGPYVQGEGVGGVCPRTDYLREEGVCPGVPFPPVDMDQRGWLATPMLLTPSSGYHTYGRRAAAFLLFEIFQSFHYVTINRYGICCLDHLHHTVVSGCHTTGQSAGRSPEWLHPS